MKNSRSQLSSGLAWSIMLHLLVISICWLKLPAFGKKIPEESVITFDILPSSSISNIRSQIKLSKPASQNQPAKKIHWPAASKPDLLPAAEKKLRTAAALNQVSVPEKPPPADAEKTLLPKAPAKPALAKKLSPQVSTDVKPARPTTKPKAAASSELDGLLKSLEKSSAGSNNQARSSGPKLGQAGQNSQGLYSDLLPLSVSEKAMITKQIEDHWNIPLGAQHLELLRVTLYIALNIDGAVAQIKIIDKKCQAASENLCQILVNSACRAVRNASPFQNLSAERYNSWKEFQFCFDPSKYSNNLE